MIKRTIITLLFTFISALKVDFVLYNERRRPTITSEDFSLIDLNKKAVIITHGWLGNAHSNYIEDLASTYYSLGAHNVIIVDWSMESTYDYLSEVFFIISSVGRSLGRFLLALNKYGMLLRNVHLVGHSLGAHISGQAGRFLKRHHRNNETIYRITGLDAAGPLFASRAHLTSFMRLRADDAGIVDCTHTNGLFLGISEAIGSVDFYINDGLYQPVCLNPLGTISLIVLNVCSHTLSTLYFNLSITSTEYKASSGRRTCENLVVYGENMAQNLSGVYYMRTENNFPYKSVC